MALADPGGELATQLRRRKNGVLALVFILVALWVLAGAIILRVAQDMRARVTLERNLTIARLAARLIDEQADGALSTMRIFSQKFPLESALVRKDKPELVRYLSSTVYLVPDLLATSAYSADGHLVASYAYPTQVPPPSEAVYRPWLQRAAATGLPTLSDVIRLPDASRTEAIALVHPVGKPGNFRGYLVAYYRLFQIDEWLNRIRFGERSAVYVVNEQSHLVTSTNTRMKPGKDLSSYTALRQAHQQPDGGSMIAGDVDGGAEATVGYAQASVPHWTVIAVQPTETAFAPTYYMLRRLTGLLVPILIAVLASAWLLVTLYERQQKLSLALAEQNEQLRKADRVKSDFLANVSHDLRTPLASVQLCISGVLDAPEPRLSAAARDGLEMASEEIDHLTRRVRNLLDMSKLEAGMQGPAFETADLTDVVAGAIERLGRILSGRRIEAEFPAEPLLLECNQAQLETVVMNLLENACKYSPQGAPISLRGWSDRSSVYCSITDEGPGVPPGDVERIFTKFYRSNSLNGVGGFGLGLAIAKAILDAHGGEIGVRATSGGSEFWFSLPRLAESGRSGSDPGEAPETEQKPVEQANNALATTSGKAGR